MARRKRHGRYRSAELDHIVPASRGGSDTIENLQLAHERCNKDKGPRLMLVEV